MQYSDLEQTLYTYKATVKKVTDGDSFWALISRGFHDKSYRNIRLARIDAPEVRGAEKEKGLITKAVVETLLPVGGDIIVRSQGNDAFGRVP